MSLLIMESYERFWGDNLNSHRKHLIATSAEPSSRRHICGDIFATIVVANSIATTHVVANKTFESNYLQRHVSDYMSSQKLF